MLSSLRPPPPPPPISLRPPLIPPTTKSLKLIKLHHHHHHLNTAQYLSLLRNSSYNLLHAKSIHAHFLKSFHPLDNHLLLLSNTLISLSAKLGNLRHAFNLFKSLPSKDVVSWTAIMSAYANCGRETPAVRLFFQMRDASIEPNEFTFVAILTAIGRLLNAELAVQFHGLILRGGFLSSVYVRNALMGIYVKCEEFDFAYQLFDEMPRKDSVAYNTLISSLCRDYGSKSALYAFGEMRENKRSVDDYAISSLIACCGCELAVEEGKQLHAYALRAGFASNLAVNNALIGYYTKCGTVDQMKSLLGMMAYKDVITWTGVITGFAEHGLIESAAQLFDDMLWRNEVSYGAMLAGYVHNGEGAKGFELFQTMLQNGIAVSDFAVTSTVKACSVMSGAEEGEQLHGFITKTGFWRSSCIEGGLVDFYAKCERMEDAKKVFDGASYSKLTSLVSMITGYTRSGLPDKALFLFLKLHREEDLTVNEYVFSAVIASCGILGFQEMGEQLYSYAIKSGLLYDVTVCNAILSMFTKCDSMENATILFNLMRERDVWSWNTLIMGHVALRQGDKALELFREMEVSSDLIPDDITFIGVLSACLYINSRSVDTCLQLFNYMSTQYGIKPTDEHSACVVSVLCRGGLLQEAQDFINNMPRPSAAVWRAFLDNCSNLNENPRLEKLAFRNLLMVEPYDPATYILLSNLYSASGRWDLSGKLREEMKARGMNKHPARSWTICRDYQVHSFYCRDRLHPQAKDIYSGLEILILECKRAGYIPDTTFVLHEVEEYQKENFLFYHSSKLAVTYALLMNRSGKPVRVTKNIRLCGDCHQYMKFAAKVTKRPIILRDSTGFHCFDGGSCSCRDCW